MNNEELIQSFLDSLPYPCFIKDLNGCYTHINKLFPAMVMKTTSDILGKKLQDVSPTEYFDKLQQQDQELVKSGKLQTIEITLKRETTNEDYIVQSNKTLWYNNKNKPIGIIGFFIDITEQHKTAQLLRSSEKKFHEIYDQSPIGVELYDVSGKLVDVNQSILDMFGVINKIELIGFNLFEDPNVSPQIQHKIQNGMPVQYIGEFSFETVKKNRLYNTTKDGIIYIDTKITPIKDSMEINVTGYLVQIQDVTQNIIREKELIFISYHDKLTGLYNRSYFEQDMSRLNTSRHARIGIIVCDIDGLKTVNDTMGHAHGDKLIINCADVLKKSFRNEDIVARIGGDEFVAILPDITIQGLDHIKRRIETNTEEINQHNEFKLSISTGFALRENQPITLEELFKKADAEMYKEKTRNKTNEP